MFGHGEHRLQVGGCVMTELLLLFPSDAVCRFDMMLIVFVLGCCFSFLEVLGCEF
jgi:hypothetical protein